MFKNFCFETVRAAIRNFKCVPVENFVVWVVCVKVFFTKFKNSLPTNVLINIKFCEIKDKKTGNQLHRNCKSTTRKEKYEYFQTDFF